MKQSLLIFICFLSSSYIRGQKQNNHIEIYPFVRLDYFPEFSYHYGGRFSTDYLKMKGTSYGISLSYKYSLKKNIFLLRPAWDILNTGLIS